MSTKIHIKTKLELLSYKINNPNSFTEDHKPNKLDTNGMKQILPGIIYKNIEDFVLEKYFMHTTNSCSNQKEHKIQPNIHNTKVNLMHFVQIQYHKTYS